jgi:prophage antirepressor-like protein
MSTTACTSSLVPFDFEGRQIRIFTDEQAEPWFVAADVCSTLGIANVSQALSRLDADEKTLISNEGGSASGPQSLNLINEPGLYTLVLGSRKPEAKRFKRWVTHEVLPSIHRSGSYAVPGIAPMPAAFPFDKQDSVKDTNQHLAACGLQICNQRGEWELTSAGLRWAEAMPYCRGGHSGYQILWNPAVVDVVRELG